MRGKIEVGKSGRVSYEEVRMGRGEKLSDEAVDEGERYGGRRE